MFPSNHKKGFTLFEMVTVIAIVGIFASFAVYNISGAMKHHKQAQAARLISNAIGEVRTFCMSASFDTSNTNFWENGKPTHLGCSIYFYQGWVNPNNVTEAGATWADGSGEDYELSYSILTVLDTGSDTQYRKESPDYSSGSTSAVNLANEKAMSDITQDHIRMRFVNLPEGVVLRTGNAGGDTEDTPAGTLLADRAYVTYDTFGRVITKKGTSGDFTYYSDEFDGAPSYITIHYDIGGANNSDLDPIYLDLRTGNVVTNAENIGSLSFPAFGS